MVKPASFSGLPKHQGTTVLESTITNTRISKSTLVVTLPTKMASLSSRKVSKFRDTPPKYISHAQQCFISVVKPETMEKRVKSNCCGSIAFSSLVVFGFWRLGLFTCGTICGPQGGRNLGSLGALPTEKKIGFKFY